MKKVTIIVIGAVMLAVPAAVYAATEVKSYKHERMFDRHDTNKDGKISKEEIDPRWANIFEKMDANADGFITKEEAKAGRKMMKEARMEMMISVLDSDKNGELSEQEVTDFVIQNFKKADANGDGSLTSDEMKDAKKIFKKEFRGHHGHGKG